MQMACWDKPRLVDLQMLGESKGGPFSDRGKVTFPDGCSRSYFAILISLLIHLSYGSAGG